MTNTIERGVSQNEDLQSREVLSLKEFEAGVYVPDFSLIPEENKSLRQYMEGFLPYFPNKLAAFPLSMSQAEGLVAKYKGVRISDIKGASNYLMSEGRLPHVSKMRGDGKIWVNLIGSRSLWGYVAISEEFENRGKKEAQKKGRWKSIDTVVKDKLGEELERELFMVEDDFDTYYEAKITSQNSVNSKDESMNPLTMDEIEERMKKMRIPYISGDKLRQEVSQWDAGMLRNLEGKLNYRDPTEQVPLGIRSEGVMTRGVIKAIQFSALFYPESDNSDENYEIIKRKIGHFNPVFETLFNYQIKGDILKTETLLSAIQEEYPDIRNLAELFSVLRKNARSMGFEEQIYSIEQNVADSPISENGFDSAPNEE